MKELFKIEKSEYNLSKEIPIPRECMSKIFVPAHGNNGKQYYYLIDLGNGTVIKWCIDNRMLIEYMKDLIRSYKIDINKYFSKTSPDTYLGTSSLTHTGRYHNNKIYLYPVYCNYILCLDIETLEYSVIFDDPLLTFCPTNCIFDDEIYYSRWSMLESLTRTRKDMQVNLELGKYDITGNKFIKIKDIKGPDGIHETIVTSDKESIVLVEMARFFNKSPNPDKANDREHMLDIFRSGLSESQIIRYDIKKDKVDKAYLDKSPSHIVFDKYDKNIAYVASVNFWTAYCFGNGRIDKFDLSTGIKWLCSYESNDFFRIPSHQCFRCNDENLLATTVYANQVHILNTDDLTLKKKIYLSENRRVPDFSNGPYKYPDHDRTPYSLHPVDNTPYIILVSLWSISILDCIEEKLIFKLNYNICNDPLSSMGHSIRI